MNFKKITIFVMFLLFLPISYSINYWGPYTIELNVWKMEPYIPCDPTTTDVDNVEYICGGFGMICYSYDPDNANNGACMSTEGQPGDPCNKRERGSSDCAYGNVCHEGICWDITKLIGAYCETEATCPAGLYCNIKTNTCIDTDGFAGNRCGVFTEEIRKDEDCNSGLNCEQDGLVGKCFNSQTQGGEECSGKFDCGAEYLCEKGVTGELTCEPTDGAPGKRCDLVDDCRLGSICKEGICQDSGIQPPGRSCTSDASCGAKLYCDGTVCQETDGADGDPCGDEDDCGTNLFCINRVCTEFLDENDPCGSNSPPCGVGLTCVSGACTVTGGDVGDNCDQDIDCDQYKCSKRTRKCYNPGGSDNCNCGVALVCKDGNCISTLGQPGDACDDDGDCNFGICDFNLNKCFKDSSDGDSCSNEYWCGPGQICTGVTGSKTCESTTGAACAQCGQESDCGSTTTCNILTNKCDNSNYVLSDPCGQDCDCGPSLSCLNNFCSPGGATPVCGNDIIDSGEQCDNTNFGTNSCTDFGYGGGVLNCVNCGFDYSQCTVSSYCGDDTIQSPNNVEFNEQCDGTDIVTTCLNYDTYDPGPVSCKSDCTVDVSSCTGPTPPTCGDAVVNQISETCDLTDLQGETCQTLGYSSGTLSCDLGCNFDISNCVPVAGPYCGDNTIDLPNNVGFNEQCDGTDIVTTCLNYDTYDPGPVSCKSDCTVDVSSCIGPTLPICGDAVVNQISETCDLTDLQGETCQTLGYASGVLSCYAQGLPNECDFNTDSCVPPPPPPPLCGNNVIDQISEDCDGTSMGTNNACTDFGYTGGTLSCTPVTCKYDKSACTSTGGPVCGNNLLESANGEECDGTDMGVSSCNDYGFPTGTLSCTGLCMIDVTSCTGAPNICGNDVMDQFSEDCDGIDLEGQTCEDRGYNPGTLLCDSSCKYDISSCGNIFVCGNNIKESGEDCDGTSIGVTCIDLGYVSGQIGCNAGTCTYDTTQCSNTAAACGDGTWTRPEEVCDASAPDYSPISCTDHCCTGGTNAVCIPAGQPNACTWDLSGCTGCVTPDFPGDCTADCHIDFTEDSYNINYWKMSIPDYLCNGITINTNIGKAGDFVGCSRHIAIDTPHLGLSYGEYYALFSDQNHWSKTTLACQDTYPYP